MMPGYRPAPSSLLWAHFNVLLTIDKVGNPPYADCNLLTGAALTGSRGSHCPTGAP